MKFWIARDPDGSLWMYDDEPILSEYGWWRVRRKTDSEIKPDKPLHDWYFPEVTYENSPQQVEVELKLIKEK